MPEFPFLVYYLKGWGGVEIYRQDLGCLIFKEFGQDKKGAIQPSCISSLALHHAGVL